jgi:WD40 repeat protein
VSICAFVAVFIARLVGSFALAADADNPFATEQEKIASAKPRTWNDRNGKFSVEAKLVKVEDGKAVLKRNDGQEIKVPLEKLSDADQKFVANITGNQSDSVADSSADTSAGNDAKRDTPVMKLIGTDFHNAKVVDLSGSGSWKYKPDVASPSEKLPAARISLKAVDFFDRPRGILIAPQEKKAYVVFYNDFKSHTSQVQACNLQTNELEAAAVFAEDEVPVAISPDGTMVLSQVEQAAGNRKGELHLYTRDGRKVKPLKGWRPYEVAGAREKDEFDTEVKWATFADSQHIFTLSTFGRLVLWEVATLKPIWATTLAFTSEPAFSAGRKYVALVSKPEASVGRGSAGRPIGGRAETKWQAAISIVGVEDGNEVANIPLDEDPGMCSVALRDDGARLALCQSGRIRVWDLTNQEVVRDFALQQGAHPIDHGTLAWTSNSHLLIGGNLLIDVERRVPIWQYNNAHQAHTVRDGKVWFLDTGLSHEARVLVGTTLPNQAAQNAVANLKPDDLLVLHPGMEVTVDCQISGDANDVAAAKAALEERLKKNGMKVVPESKVHLVATVQPGKNVRIRYHSWGTPPSAGQEYEVATQVLSLSFDIDGQSVWKYEASTMAPSFLQLQKNENIDQALQRVMKQQEDYFPKRCTTIWIPAYMARLPGEGDANNNSAPAGNQKPRGKSTRGREA